MNNIKVGDLVEITADCSPFFTIGDRAVITEFDGSDWWADFNHQGNPQVMEDGKWCIGSSVPREFKLIQLDKELSV
jgi:hypothetical protein